MLCFSEYWQAHCPEFREHLENVLSHMVWLKVVLQETDSWILMGLFQLEIPCDLRSQQTIFLDDSLDTFLPLGHQNTAPSQSSSGQQLFPHGPLVEQLSFHACYEGCSLLSTTGHYIRHLVSLPIILWTWAAGLLGTPSWTRSVYIFYVHRLDLQRPAQGCAPSQVAELGKNKCCLAPHSFCWCLWGANSGF